MQTFRYLSAKKEEVIGIGDVDSHEERDLMRAIVLASFQEAGGTTIPTSGVVDSFIYSPNLQSPCQPNERAAVRLARLHPVKCQTFVWQMRRGLFVLERTYCHLKDMDAQIRMLHKAIEHYESWKKEARTPWGSLTFRNLSAH